MIDILWKILKMFIFILVILMILITFAKEPQLSYNYYKALSKNGFKVIGEVIKMSSYSVKPNINSTAQEP